MAKANLFFVCFVFSGDFFGDFFDRGLSLSKLFFNSFGILVLLLVLLPLLCARRVGGEERRGEERRGEAQPQTKQASVGKLAVPLARGSTSLSVFLCVWVDLLAVIFLTALVL